MEEIVIFILKKIVAQNGKFQNRVYLCNKNSCLQQKYSKIEILRIILYDLYFRDVPGLPDSSQKWKQTALKFVGLNAHYNKTQGRYGFGNGKFLMAINFTAPADTKFMAGRAVGLLPELPKKESFEKDICNSFFEDPCNSPSGSKCPIRYDFT